MRDDKLPSCVAFGIRLRKRVLAKLDKFGCDWMPPKVSNDWFLAGLVFDLLHGLIDNDDEEPYNYKLFLLLGYKLIDLVSSVNHALNNLDEDKEN